MTTSFGDIDPVLVESLLDHLDADALEHLGSVLRERAAHRRLRISVEEAKAAVESAPVSREWRMSRFSDVGKVRTSTRMLITNGWHPEQIIDPMSEVAESLSPHPLVAIEALAAGLSDAARI